MIGKYKNEKRTFFSIKFFVTFLGQLGEETGDRIHGFPFLRKYQIKEK